VAKFLSPEFTKKVPDGSRPTLIFVDTCISLKHSVGLVERSPLAKNQINPFIPFDSTRLVTDRQTDTDTDTGPYLVPARASMRRAGENLPVYNQV